MTLCRIKNPEQLKKTSTGEFGKLLGLDRIPELKYFRIKLKQVIDQSRTDDLHTALFQDWVEALPEVFFYIDGHVMVYHGEQANLPKRFVSREKLCLPGSTEFWVNDQKGLPLMVVSAELNEKIKTAIQRAESALYNIMSEFYNDNDKEGRMILKEIFTTDADMIPDYYNNKLTIRLHTLSTPRPNRAVKELCEFLNQTQTRFPYTNLMLNYQTVAI